MRMIRSVLVGQLLVLSAMAQPRSPATPTAPARAASAAGRGESSDIEIGGPGSGPGEFIEIEDIAFGPEDRLYTLEASRYRRNREKEWRPGNCRVQVFKDDGTFLRQFPVRGPGLDAESDLARLAVDGRGNVYVTRHEAGLVQQYGPDGAWVRDIPVPAAHAIAVRKMEGREQILVVPRPIVKRRVVECSQVFVLDPDGRPGDPIPLARPVTDCQDLTTDAAGRLYLQASLNVVFLFDARGGLVTVLGGGTRRNRGDGSELLRTVAVDSRGNLYSMTPGNPGKVTKFSPDLKTVSLRPGQFRWNDAWGGGVDLAFDSRDRLWVMVPGSSDGSRNHSRPCVLRVKPDLLERGKEFDTIRLGLDAAVETGPEAPYGILHELKPVPFTFVVRPAYRQVKAMRVTRLARDTYGAELDRGTFDLKLEDGVEARHESTFTPPRWGWYTVEYLMETPDGTSLGGDAACLGAVPPVEGMPSAAAKGFRGGWEDDPRQAFCGLRLMRVNTRVGVKSIEAHVKACESLGLTLLVQFEGKEHCTPEEVREVVGALKGRVKYWELINEPNLTMSPDAYADLVKRTAPIIRELDPEAGILGPAVCGIKLDWCEQFFETGAGKLLDAVSVHDYEGNESFDPAHWRWKFGELRAMLARHGLGDRPLWQTERATGAIRGSAFLGVCQAVRVTLHRDLLETLGVPPEHNLHFYLNEGGYSKVPTYLWSAAGPYPGALALRTRDAMTRGRRYAGTLDFGPGGNAHLMALRYTGDDGETVILRHLGVMEAPAAAFRVGGGGGDIEVVDSFGNRSRVPVKDGRASVTVPPLPVYLRLAKGRSLIPEMQKPGRNLAPDAAFTFTGITESPFSILTDGLFQVAHSGNPWGETWLGNLDPADPPVLEIRFEQPRAVDRVHVYGVRADNPHSTLLDFDLRCADGGGGWRTLKEVRASFPPSTPVTMGAAQVHTWYDDRNMAVLSFPAVTTDRLRIVARRSTFGFIPDAEAAEASGQKAGPLSVRLKEIEIYGPPPPLGLATAMDPSVCDRALAAAPMSVTVTNRTDGPRKVTIRLTGPSGWTADSDAPSLDLAAGEEKKLTVRWTPPAEIPEGWHEFRASLVDDAGRRADYNRVTLRVIAPIRPKPAMPKTLDPARQPMSITVRNLRHEPLGGVVRLAMAGPTTIPPVEASFPPVPPGKSETVEVSVPGLDLTKGPWRADWTVRADRIVTTEAQDFAGVRMWRVVGPFPNAGGAGFDAVFAPETGTDFTRPVPLPGDGGGLHWKVAANQANGFLDLYGEFKPNEQVCAYAAIRVRCPSARKVRLLAGSDDCMKSWVNGKLVISRNGSHPAAPGQEQVEIDLKAGDNDLLFKIPQGNGGWGMYCDLVGLDGKLMPDLEYRCPN